MKLQIQGNVKEVDARYATVSGLLQLQQSQAQGQIVELPADIVTQEIFDVIQSYYEHNDFKPVLIEKADVSPDKLFFNDHDKNLIMKYQVVGGNSDQLKKLLDAANYLQMNHLKKLCLARIMLEFHFDKTHSQDSLNALKAKYQQVKPVTLQDIERYNQKYPEITSQFK